MIEHEMENLMNIHDLRDKISEYLKEIDSLDFNIFNFENFVGKDRSMKLLTKYVLESTEAYSYLNDSKFDNFIDQTKKKYRDNPYHNVNILLLRKLMPKM